MERLTKNINGVICYVGEHKQNDEDVPAEMTTGAVRNVLTSLFAYEEAEKQGRLVVLPCKVGDEVWFVCKESGFCMERGVYRGIVTRIKGIQRRDAENLYLVDVDYELLDPYYNDGRKMKSECQCSYTEYGSWKRFYLTREAAEEALQKTT